VRILIVTSWFPTPECPVSGTFVAEQAAALAARHEVGVLATSVATNKPSRLLEEEAAYTIIRAAVPAARHRYDLEVARAIVREVKAGRYDVIHAHVTLPAGFASVLAASIARCPVVITEHMGPFKTQMRTMKARAKVRYALRNASAVVAVSSGLKCQMRQYGIRRPIHVVPNLVDSRRFALQPRPARTGNAYEILFVGRLNDAGKNLPALLQAVSLLTDGVGPGFRLRVAGDGELRGTYERLARELGISSHCEFLGYLKPIEVAQALRDCDLLVLPSLYENCPVAVAEALVVGRPVVVTRCGGSEEMVNSETGIVVPVNDPGALAEAIETICNNLHAYRPEEISAYGQARFGDQVIVRELSLIYQMIRRRRLNPMLPILRRGYEL
jgi:glycosyltransferase involved in cell wall biosynthesis